MDVPSATDDAGVDALVLDVPGGHAHAPNQIAIGDFHEKIPQDSIHQTFFRAH